MSNKSNSEFFSKIRPFLRDQGLSSASGQAPYKAQGTIEYLVIIAVVVVLSLVVVGIISSTSGNSIQSVSQASTKIGQSIGGISISEAVVSQDGNGSITLANNSGGVLYIKRVQVEGVDSSYNSTTALPQGSKTNFIIGDVGLNCDCNGLVGKTKTCSVIITANSEYGVEKIFESKVTVDCVTETTPNTQVPIVIPLSSEKKIITFDLNGIWPKIHGTIYDNNKTIGVRVPFGTTVIGLVPIVTVSDKATISPSSLVSLTSNPQTYRVTAENGTTQDYNVNVTVAPLPTYSRLPLEWDESGNPDAKPTWWQAIAYCASLPTTISTTKPAGTVWTLPDYNELVDKYNEMPGTPAGFQSHCYWSRTPFVSNEVYIVWMNDGWVGVELKPFPDCYIRCVR